MTNAADAPVNGKPLFIASIGGTEIRPGLTTDQRAPHIYKKRLQKTEVKEMPGIIRAQDRVAAKDVVFQDAGKSPPAPAITGICPARLPEIGSNTVKLPPSDGHAVVIGRIHANGRFVRGIISNVVAVGIDVDLVTGEGAELRDHPAGAFAPVNVDRWILNFLMRLGEKLSVPFGATRDDGQPQNKKQKRAVL